ncbi:hypothetical protein [Gellertiella hungarica]|uniref:Uncharacterized protein n=1 Tax=Gellertiella hungarica TaxID=1572859 RepID=A0A7W6NLR2_9HYPH|nr:hypothetical protein [Gellertiella hungarica]MBB4066785.1 hypothetical protein [Gellertiella hungarica]
MRDSDVIEFIVVPPADRVAELTHLKEQFLGYLTRCFPQFMFKLAPFAPVGDGRDFGVYPIMNYLADDGKSRMCNPPANWTMAEIAEACRGFTAGVGRA